ncbi:MAG: hypothetical protein IPI98_02265 [Chitinophagaceae bacterium]|nr:hypothetical protein [Chitinophagaceae bacterium]
MKNKMTHFAIHIDDMERAKYFMTKYLIGASILTDNPTFFKSKPTKPKMEN